MYECISIYIYMYMCIYIYVCMYKGISYTHIHAQPSLERGHKSSVCLLWSWGSPCDMSFERGHKSSKRA